MASSPNHKISEVTATPNFPEIENKWLKNWSRDKVVEKYLTKNSKLPKTFSFIDGPITANNPMGVHHAWGRTYKDLWQRYFNMNGFAERFQNGFDCQGLWVEVEVEKELGFKSKKDIEDYGIERFVDLCKQRVLKYSQIQTEQSQRLGYFMDWDHSYFTMSDENNYAIWNFLKVCWQKNFIYQGHDTVPWCPRCETAISQHEMLTEDYKELTHKSIYLGLPLNDRDHEYLLVWTTTPWTIPANTAVAVDPKKTYSLIETNNGLRYWVLKELVEKIFKDCKTISSVIGEKLVGLKYSAPFDDIPAVKKIIEENPDKIHLVIASDPLILPISNEEGTGLVHTATSAGTEDFMLGKKLGLPVIPIIADNADYLDDLGFLSGQNAKKHPEIILDYLTELDKKGDNWVFSIENYTHRYPACWRCKTELVWKITDEWYIAMDKIDPNDDKKRTLRQKMIDVAQKINWIPKFGLERELDWLSNMHDWLISKKNRYWGLALPIWICPSCQQFEVIGSFEELEKRATSGWSEFAGHSPHKPFIDAVKIKCQCGQEMTRTEDVGNPWLDAGIVSFSTLKYSTDKKYWQKWFPADFITESFPGQFKNWFYSLIAMSTVLEDQAPFKTVLGYASVVGEDGRPMHKSWGNSIEFNEAAEKIGVDVMRWLYLKNNPERNLPFGINAAADTKRQFHLILWNSYRYFANFASLEFWSPVGSSPASNILDIWILARLKETVSSVTKFLDEYNAFNATQAIESFVSDLSTWYIRRSRDRFGPNAPDISDKNQGYQTLNQIFDSLSRVLMPFTPFLAEEIYTNLTGEKSVNLADWPKTEKPTNQETTLIEAMAKVRKICELGHAERKKENLAVKQPLAKINVKGIELDDDNLIQLIKDELNIEAVIFTAGENSSISLDTNLTPTLINKGRAREIIRTIQQARKEANCRLDEYIDITLPEWPADYTEDIKKKTLVRNLEKAEILSVTKIN
jgi:isoleucyl-tRNA synthetase